MFVDTALREHETAGRPIRVGMIGAGATGRAIALQLGTHADRPQCAWGYMWTDESFKSGEQSAETLLSTLWPSSY